MTIVFSTSRLLTQVAALGGAGIIAIAVLAACDGNDTTFTRTPAASATIPVDTAPRPVAPSTTELPPLSATETFQPVPAEASGPECLPTDRQSVPGQDAATIAPPSPGAQWWVDRIGGTVCPGLSWAELNVLGATGSSPWQLLIYHNGFFLGTGTRCNLPYQSIVGHDRESVTVAYKFIRGDEPLAAPSGRATVTYRWNGSRVVMDGTLPTALTQGRC